MDASTYEALYRQSIERPDEFWAKQAERIVWRKKWDQVSSGSFSRANDGPRIRWFEGGKLNITESCLDRHAAATPTKTALLFEPDHPEGQPQRISYAELLARVCKTANVLKNLGVQKGDRVTLYMPMIPDAAISMLACARLGAVHSVVFGGFSPESLAGRIEDCESEFVITADAGVRGGKRIPLKDNVDAALKQASRVKKVLVFRAAGGEIAWDPARDVWYHEAVTDVPQTCPPEVMDAEDPLFILYTSGSTNKPKGVLHTSAGYLVYAALTHEVVFDLRPGDVYWCTADVGWVTGHSYVVYGPLSNGATSVIFEGVPTFPTSSRFWEVIDRHNVTVFYTAPTALRSLQREGDSPVLRTSRKSLRVLGSVGEPINAEAWHWYREVVGGGRCPIVDTWWQTETGGILITPLPGVSGHGKPSSATKPFFGIEPAILTPDGKELQGEAEGVLCLKRSWPGQARTVYRAHDRFRDTYFSQYPGYYFTGDGARRDAEGDYWISGRVDDVINVSGHRLGTAEIESAIDTHPGVVESAVVGFPHAIKGQGIYAFVILMEGASNTEAEAIRKTVRKIIGPLAMPDVIQIAPGLPKTRSGKIMRRILRKIAEGHSENLGDTSTLAEPAVVEKLVSAAQALRPKT